MTVMVQEPLSRDDADVVLEGFLALDTPEGFRAELIDGEIVVTPPPLGDHEDWIAELSLQIVRDTPRRFHWAGQKGLVIPGDDEHRENRVIPDMVIAPAELRLFRGAPEWMRVEPEGIAMVVEVTSSRPENDREGKRYGYARAGIPLYLLIDRDERKVLLFSGPDGGDYAHIDQVQFGKPLPLPEPFDIDLDTSAFG
ncbi:Uma2 family endonuclease [Actinomadura sp. K4S16]|uniref:Uma2 family endonuclease n=1 Tax=Actinomadura sp. K4S16 TaxID=1316147 RepID=UPI00190F31A1|nr:Uma2 family endonuclease [Actinomadura sp. K4S16]